jgi:hypothetical protein
MCKYYVYMYVCIMYVFYVLKPKCSNCVVVLSLYMKLTL